MVGALLVAGTAAEEAQPSPGETHSTGVEAALCAPTKVIAVTFKIGEDGWVVGPVTAAGDEVSNEPAVRSAALAAIAKVRAASPFKTLPREFWNETVKVSFAPCKGKREASD